MTTQPRRRSALPPFITASRWGSVWQSAWETARRVRGAGNAPDGTTVPRLTNAEALTVALAWRDAAGARFPLWDQFAAVAYGWNPPARDVIDSSAKRHDGLYPLDTGNELWLSTSSLADDLDAEGVPDPRLDLADRFNDGVSQAKVAASLRADGARAKFSIPTGVCRDDKTRKTRPPKVECVSQATGRRQAPRFVNGLPYCPAGFKLEAKCPPGTHPIVIDDPLTALIKTLLPIALILVALGVIRTETPRRSRRMTE